MAPTNPLDFLPPVPSLDNSFGAFLLATFLGLMLYGLTLHQSYRYYRLFREDIKLIKTIVFSTVVLETIHIVLCMHICYYYLVTNYFNPLALLDGVWSIRILPISTALVILLSEGFFVRRVYLIGARYRPVVLVIVISKASWSASVEAFIRPTFADFDNVAWMTSAAFGAAVVIDLLLTGTLIITLHKSRTGFKRTDSLIDVLIIYTINTGLLTGIFSVLSLIFALVSPDNLIYSAFNIIATKCYANSLLAVLNSRKMLADKIQEDCFNSGSFVMSSLQRTTIAQRNAAERWNVPQLPENTGTGTILDIKIQKDVNVITQGDGDSVNTDGLEPK
ncbi:hypothetical protein ONZ51_g8892 [Trametes cubensis]|uniref:DUF6534 domain-containing protein n=1 Tax=Trametes cubensis TaxID=1111947 RepID=A0AAD7X890_9APHY|nr:hypothetical protein ONZ51_g8892 [Trametes cubensis]